LTRACRCRPHGDNHAIEGQAGIEGRGEATDSGMRLRPSAGTSGFGEGASGVVYGLIALGAFLSAVLATLLYWLLHSYAGLLGRRLGGGSTLGPGALARAVVEERSVLRGAAIPLCALVLAWLAGASQGTAVSIALWSTVASVVGFEALAGLRAGVRGRGLLLEVAVGIAMGLAILGLRIILH
jgi:hypothetical protein